MERFEKQPLRLTKSTHDRNFPDPGVVNGLIECEGLSNLG